ncbi:hypothetical protein [Mastigocoleus testarum]|uniref:hypothetical protein n=1 Tax=Mastigocoleus testarum TaxID=996925 RepID=UPI000427CF75|nr:hypothetical protein [Mastigocoleus testarum]
MSTKFYVIERFVHPLSGAIALKISPHSSREEAQKVLELSSANNKAVSSFGKKNDV